MNSLLKTSGSLSIATLLTLLLTACGGGSSSDNSGGTPPPTALNVVPIQVEGNVFGALNTPYVSITLCSPSDAANCMTIDHILVDTGSVGLRVFSQPVINGSTADLSSLNLTPQTSSGNPIVECLPFAQGVTWGSVNYANLHIGGKSANNVALQVIADPAFSSVPTACSNQGTLMNTTSALSANGILGVGLYPQDCGPLCATASTQMNIYFNCSPQGQNCINTAQPLANQIQHPVTLFDTDNNGIMLTLNSVPDNGAALVTGTLTFGIDSQSNNASTNTNTILIDNNPNSATFGYFNTSLNGQLGAQNYPNSFLDSGSNGYFFTDNAITPCATFPGFYCPTNTLALSPTISGSAGSTAPVTVGINIANAASLFSNSTFVAFNNVGGTATNSTTFDFGLPFFYGKSVFIAIEGSATAKGTGPYVGW